jgi:hypothetical protein
MSHSHDDEIEALLRKQFDGPVPDDGFSERVMQRLPPHRRRAAWLSWAGILVGAGSCWLSLLSTPLLHIGWQDWMGGELSPLAIYLLMVLTGISLLAFCWAMMEADDQ